MSANDTFQRINYLHQASELVNNDVLSSYYGNLMKQISKKSVIKLDPAIKRNFCKRCSIYLKAPQNCSISALKKDQYFVIKCNNCQFEKKYPTKEYKLWLENPESIQKEDTSKSKQTQDKQNKKMKKKHEKAEKNGNLA